MYRCELESFQKQIFSLKQVLKISFWTCLNGGGGGCDINPPAFRTKHMLCPKIFAKTEQVPFLSGYDMSFLLQNIACFRS